MSFDGRVYRLWFVPLHPFQPAKLTNVVRLLDGQAQFIIHGNSGRHHELQASTNLADWEVRATVLTASNTVRLVETNSTTVPQQFYRTQTLR